ncbi:MAG TPA: hypothetical protein VLD19_01955 [Chitinophagaceae bacterium]|nr:hypothetical protein [Chitinophagaceae bacterium]
MHPLKYLLPVVLACAGWHHAGAQHTALPAKKVVKHIEMKNTVEHSFGNDILMSFKKSDAGAYQLLYPSNEEYLALLQLMLQYKVEGLTQEKIDEMIEHRRRDAAAVYAAEYREFRRQADSLHIDWNAVLYEKFDYIAAYPENFPVKYLNGDIWFSSGKRHFVLEGIEAVKIKPGYRLQAIKAIRSTDNAD